MAEYSLGNPERLNTDIGPVIDAEAKDNIDQHIAKMREKGRTVFQAARASGDDLSRGTFVTPTLIELDSFDEMQREIFGPVLHVVRYARANLGKLLQQINDSGYGLTLGVHTRIDETIAQVVSMAKVGNLYVNRNIVGAVVGVQPFGGEGLSGTGPKAGGPLYMYRLLGTRPQDAVAKQLQQQSGEIQPPAEQSKIIQALQDWADKHEPSLPELISQFAALAQSGTVQILSGPTGERNSYSLLPREHVLCLADARSDLLVQLAAALAVGCQVLWQENELSRELFAALPKAVQQRITLLSQWSNSDTLFDTILHHGDSDQLREVCQLAAQRPGAIISVHGLNKGETDIPLERLLVEYALSVNTAAAGGNASLMTIG
jgi:RHH-type proline utilization regulon transcriptional repressor/proline dehydrogenase/delta 1-pyrroline-5-carboxylate dehydrogenase